MGPEGERPIRRNARIIWFALLAIAAGCADAGAPDTRPLVAVSVLPQKFVVERIAGDLVRVAVMIPPGASPATHEPALAQLRALAEASLYVKVGHPDFAFERAWLDAMLADAPGLPVVDAAGSPDRAAGDPHVWVAPRRLEQMAVRVEAALAELLPDRRDVLAANLAQLRREIDALDAEIRHRLAGCARRSFFVFHAAWGYFAEAYGLEQVPVEQGHKEPDARELARLIAQAREAKARVVFAQPQFDAAAAQTLANEIGARVEILDPLAPDWDENLRRVTRALAAELCE